ncbi:hypothetical protein LOC68_17505 [Blastopirellula sp. JC732]|uniref:Carboxypeptidase regulatory-like domain-containing protein n=1 Tax=Blastopirellula sediminis TaxID=2894196 RepID=A0A9X1SKX3_9BACT|nr:hypothetical protein [Blastopirellula sediminis]MCC9606508.1 hypothetical protein [Blastopirellula sediminis]MCC9630194.1 hypothetical protein [Blastopirellula sediminis]
MPFLCRSGAGPLTAALCVVALALAGCNSKSGGIVVTGDVQFDGQPLQNGLIHFEPMGGAGASAARRIDGGKYEFDANSNMKPGKYKVAIRATQPDSGLDADAAMNRGPQPPFVDPIPKKYSDKTELTVEVTEAGPNKFDFDLKSK